MFSHVSASKIKLPVRVAIFASGVGSNAKKIIEYFNNNRSIDVALIISNKRNAGVLHIASHYNISTILIEKEEFFQGKGYVEDLKKAGISFIVLAGFLLKIPEALILAFPNKIINIHPALLPKYGGKGMYGLKVHEAVIAAGDNQSGITIHYVDEQYDNGDIIFQATCPVFDNDTPDTLAERIHMLEHENYARVIENCIKNSQDLY